jgi:hypothetical protein
VLAVSVGNLGQSLEKLLDGGGHGETGGSDADAGPAAVADDGHASFGHAFYQVAGEIAVAAVPDPLAVDLAKGGPPLAGELQGVAHRGPTFWVVVVELNARRGAGDGVWIPD